MNEQLEAQIKSIIENNGVSTTVEYISIVCDNIADHTNNKKLADKMRKNSVVLVSILSKLEE